MSRAVLKTWQTHVRLARFLLESDPDLLPICTRSAPDLIRICTGGLDMVMSTRMSAALVVVKTGSLKCEHMFPILFLCDRGVPHPDSKINRRGESIIQSNGQIISGIGPKRTQTSQMTRRAFISVPPPPGLIKPYHGGIVVASTHFPLVEH